MKFYHTSKTPYKSEILKLVLDRPKTEFELILWNVPQKYSPDFYVKNIMSVAETRLLAKTKETIRSYCQI